MKQKFLKPEHDIDMDAVDYWNIHKKWEDCFEGIKNIEFINEKTIVNHRTGKESFTIKGDFLHVSGENELGLPLDKKYTKFSQCDFFNFNITDCQSSIGQKQHTGAS